MTLSTTQTFAQGEHPKVKLTPKGDAMLKLDSNNYDFGKKIMGTQVTHVFTFINAGSAPLVIHSVPTSCGCTIISYTKEPILPEQQGEIKVMFNSTGKSGNFEETFIVKYNGDQSPDFLSITGEVIIP